MPGSIDHPDRRLRNVSDAKGIPGIDEGPGQFRSFRSSAQVCAAYGVNVLRNTTVPAGCSTVIMALVDSTSVISAA